ncbi:dienelactone hydrolase family protein [Allobranchiibius huperziae]|uniref:Dienelactone hydrolase n=1 Tax=Allobranchiibius huperziae TaxID=1874116 RepID=A0A853DJI4_9MICO|nr:dienelactone hydrolase family protein [Allobranchiibius huperziae]NYJ76193.1 dienelactone hydrolase [Allobranchiibius huperziae]
MAEILLLHSALGLRPAVEEYADLLRAGGHLVRTPDFYDGHVFDIQAEGIAYRDEVGGRTLLARVKDQLGDLLDDAVLAGFSLGAAFAQHLSAARPAAHATILLHAVGPVRGDWPGMPVQVHRYASDPIIEESDVVALGAAVRASGASFEDVVVPGSGHLFTDLGVADGDRDARDRSVHRVLDLLSS